MSYENIRIGTLVQCSQDSANYIKQILPHGFESFSLTFWRTTKGICWEKLADSVNEAVDGSGAVISSLAVFGNPLETDEEDLETLQSWKDAIDNAHLFNCDIVGGFTGRLRNKPLYESLPRFKEVWSELAKYAADKGIRIAFENCDMDGDWLKGDWNIAHDPAAWDMMFNEVPDENLGLEWEPCHQMVSLIDPMPQLREWIDKIFHVHGKDATINWDVVRKYGVHSRINPYMAKDVDLKLAPQYVYPRTPGFGDSNWTDIISELRKGGFKGCIDIEGWHDPVYRDELEMTGQVHALNYLKNCRGGDYIKNPD